MLRFADSHQIRSRIRIVPFARILIILRLTAPFRLKQEMDESFRYPEVMMKVDKP